MHKIYSRKTIKIPKKYENTSKMIKNKAIITILLIIALFTANYILQIIDPLFELMVRGEIHSLGTIISNEEATQIMVKYEYNDLFYIEKSEENEIQAIKANMIAINEITSDIAKNIQNEFDTLDRVAVNISLGSITGIPFLSGLGNDIELSVIPIGTIETELKSEFVSTGINQTIHKIYIDVKCNLKILSAFTEIEEIVSNQVLLMENLIIGEIPTNYYNFNGLEGKDVLEMVD